MAPVKPFTDKTRLSVSNILDLAQRAEFFNQLKTLPLSTSKEWRGVPTASRGEGKGGDIYLFQYKKYPLVFYKGRTNNFEYRLKSHLNRKLSDKFHVFANIVGWDKFNIKIVEISETKDLGIRENYYLQIYLPLLYSTFSSNFTEAAIYETLTKRLKSWKLTNTNTSDKSPYSGVSLLVYKILNTQIDPRFVKYFSINKAC